MQMDLDAAVAGARAQLRPSEPVGPLNEQGQARFELFHAPNSICSQKARVVLAHHGVPYLSNSMNIRAGDTYLPGFVRLRMAACDLAGLPLVATHSGSTAVETTGCDPAVVPLLVDWHARKLVIDSKRICLYLDKVAGDSALRPAALAQAIDEELDVVDGLPNYQMLVGKAPETHGVPATHMAGTGVTFAVSKVERCDRYLAEFPDDKLLQRAYRAKRAKEAAAAEQLFSAEAMQLAYEKAEAGCEGLEQKLSARASTWLYGETVSMADLFWAIELLRMKNLGADVFWRGGKRPRVEAFVDRCEVDLAIRAAVLDWPGALF